MKKVKRSYVIIIALLVLTVTFFGASYAYFSNKVEGNGKLNIVVGDLTYRLESEDLSKNKLTVSANSSKEIIIKLTSLNTINSKYELYYLLDDNSDVEIGYSANTKDSVLGTIGAYEVKEITIVVNNNSSSDAIIEFSVLGGLISNELVLNKGNSLNTEVNISICVPGTEYVFEYTGSEQEFVVPCDGNYKIELWGAGGINIYAQNNSMPGLGAYTSGNIELAKDTELYVYVGNQLQYSFLSDSSTLDINYFNRGATDIRLVDGNWYSFESLKSRIMVSASGGSVEGYDNYITTGGAGGGLTGYVGTLYSARSDTILTYPTSSTQISGGTPGSTSYNSIGGSGSFGSNSKNYYAGNGYYSGASGGGDGYYTVFSNGGGSSFISGHNGCNAISKNSTVNNIIHTSQSIHYSDLYFTNTMMIDGTGYNWTNIKESYVGMPTFDGITTMSGNNGNGYAKITYLGDNTMSATDVLTVG